MGSLTVRIGLVLLACAVLLEAGPIDESAFGPQTVVQDFDGFGLPLFNPTPISFGDGTYFSDGGDTNNLRYLPVGDPPAVTGFSGDAVGEGFSFLDVVFGTPVKRAGATMGTILDWTAQASFFDEQDALLGAVEKTAPGGQGVFAGWEADSGLIKRIRFTRSAATQSIIAIDNLLTEAPPPDQPLALISGGFRDAAPYTTEFASQQLEVVIRLHLVAGAGVTAADLLAATANFEAEIEGKWNGYNVVIDGVEHAIVIDVRFLDDALFDPILGQEVPAALVTDVTLWPDLMSAPGGNANTVNWVNMPFVGAHEFGHILGNGDEYFPIVPLVEEDLTSLMGSITGSRNVYPRHFFWAQAYFDGLGIETTISGLPPMEMIEGEPLSTIEGDVGAPVAPLTIVYTVPEPTTLALLALGVGFVMWRRKRAA